MPRRRRRPAPPPEELPVLIDTNVWVAFHARRDRAVRDEVTRLLGRNAACFIPPVLLEFARGLPERGAAFDYAFARYRARFRLVPLVAADWPAAVRLARSVEDGKHAAQPADLLLAAVAARTGYPVWSRDPDLDRLAGAESRVRLYSP